MAIALEAQTTPPAQPAPGKANASKLVTLVGCVASDGALPGEYTIVDAKRDTTYRLRGTDMRSYVGQRVEVTRESPPRVKITGGLVPSPNAAAQAGAVDPPPAAAMGPTGLSTRHVEEFHVKSVRPVSGTCPQR